MKFGRVKKPKKIDFTIPADHPDTKRVLGEFKRNGVNIGVGRAKWKKTDFKDVYPKGKV